MSYKVSRKMAYLNQFRDNIFIKKIKYEVTTHLISNLILKSRFKF